MVVYSCCLGDVVTIGEGVSVRVERVVGDRVKIAIEAPNTMSVYRGEFVEYLQRQMELERVDRVPYEVSE